MDPEAIGTGLAALGAAEVSKDAIQRILAPTADYVGAGILNGAKATVNTVRVLAIGVMRLGRRIESDGRVPPRVMREILDQAPFCDDELTAEYLGGILASSYSNRSRDDRGVALIAAIRRLSTYSIRMHYVCYREFASLFPRPLPQKPVFDSLPNTAAAIDLRIFANFTGFQSAMDLTPEEDLYKIYFHGSEALARENLLTTGNMGDAAFLKESIRAREGDEYEFDGEGFIYQTTMAGDELFSWGSGLGGSEFSNLAPGDKGQGLGMHLDEVAPSNFVRLSDLKPNA
jgi:hypothetical protein